MNSGIEQWGNALAQKISVNDNSAAGIGLGVLVSVVLLLLAVLQVQWVVYWRRLPKEQKRMS